MIAILTITDKDTTTYEAITLPDAENIGALANTRAIQTAVGNRNLESVDYPNRAISIFQPWAWAIKEAGKDLENRSRKICRPGWYFLHACKGGDCHDFARAAEFIVSTCNVANPPSFDECERGGVIAAIKFGEWVEQSKSPWFVGPKAVRILAVVPLPFKAGRGMQGPFPWNHDCAFDLA